MAEKGLTSWANDQLTKLQIDKIWQEVSNVTFKKQVDEMAKQCVEKMSSQQKWLFEKAGSWWNDQLTNLQTDKMLSWWKSKLSKLHTRKQQVDKMTHWIDKKTSEQND
jgi:hypothetical protein